MLDELIAIVGRDNVRTDPAFRETYAYDAFMRSARPDVVVLPRSADEIAPIVRAVHRAGAPLTPRGAGTGYCGGAVPVRGGVVLALGGLRGLAIDDEAGRAVVEPGVITGELQRQAVARGWRWVPDPSSFSVCTIGGNIATNAGGSHSLLHGNTSRWVDWIDLVLPDGEEVRLDRGDIHDGGLDLRGVVVGSEGTLGIVARAGLRLSRLPAALGSVYASFADDERAVAFLIECFEVGLVPAAMDLIASPLLPDGITLRAGHDATYFIAIEGGPEEVYATSNELCARAQKHGGRAEALDSGGISARRLVATVDAWREIRARTGATRYFLFDAGVPRSRLADALRLIRATAQAHTLPVGNSFHAGDGNLHPAAFFTSVDAGSVESTLALWREILRGVAALGGTISGEHGVGLEKVDFMELYYSRQQLDLMRRLQRVFDPDGGCNPGKLIPPPSGRELPEPSPHAPAIEIDQHNGLVWAPADVTFAALDDRLAGCAYELGWWPLVGGDISVGTAVSEGIPGIREATLPARDCVLAVGIAGAMGELTLGVGIAKDVGGYELRKLLFGARGRLGRVTRVALSLIPRARVSADYTIRVATTGDALTLAAKLAQYADVSAIAVTGGALAVKLRLEQQRGVLTSRCRGLETAIGAWAFVRQENVPLSRWTAQSLAPRRADDVNVCLPRLVAQGANALVVPAAGVMAHDGALPPPPALERLHRLRAIEAAVVMAFTKVSK